MLLTKTNFTIRPPIGTNTAATNRFNLTNSMATNFPHRFYRALEQ